MLKRSVIATLALLTVALPIFSRSVEISPENRQREFRIRSQLGDLAEMYGKLQMLTRIAGDQDRVRLETKILDMQEKARTYGDRLDGIMRDAERLVADRKFDAELDGLTAEMSRYVSGCREFMDQVRKRVMTVKRVPTAVRRTDAALLRASQLAKKVDGGPESFTELRRAFELQEDAKQALVAREYDKAMRLTLKARDLIGECLQDALDEGDLTAAKQRAADFWKATNRMIERAGREVDADKNPRAARLLDMAKMHQIKAREAADAGKPYEALRHAQSARTILTEMGQFYRRAQNADQRIERLGQKLSDARRIVDESGDATAQRILDKAAEHFEKAKDLRKSGNAAGATAQLDIAMKLGTKAVDLAKGGAGMGPVNAQREIKKTELIVRKAESEASTDEQKALASRARDLLTRAGAQTSNPPECLRLLDKATDLAFGVLAQQRKQDVPESDEPVEDDAR